MRAQGDLGKLPAAGMPWFMTVFGRDTIITCLQTLLFGPELARERARGAGRAPGDGGRSLARRRAGEDRPRGPARQGGQELVRPLLRHGRRDAALPRPALGGVALDGRRGARQRAPRAGARALEWIDEYGDRDGDGFVEYQRRTERGLDNQSWKDSGDSQRFPDGTSPKSPIAPCEVQGYVYDAKLRMAELAREVWRDRALADRLEQDADRLKSAFDEAFWVEERGGYYALALDRDKKPVDSLRRTWATCSGAASSRRSGSTQIVDAPDGRPALVRLGRADDVDRRRGFNPLWYHNGTVWPHDNSLIAWGWPATRAGRRRSGSSSGCSARPSTSASSCRRSSRALRAETPFPIAYPTAARPQAWAAGTPVLLARSCSGCSPTAAGRRSRRSRRELPSWAGDVRLTGVRPSTARGTCWSTADVSA